MSKLTSASEQTFIGAVIDVFERFLDSKNIVIKNDEKTDAIDDGCDPDTIANIYGSDYGTIQTDLENLIAKWELIK